MTPEQKISQAKTKLVLHHPFFATFVLKTEFVKDKSAPTMWTDGVKVGYNPEFVEGLSVDQVMAVIVHEMYHVLFLHHLREGYRNHMKWNMAGDYAINGLIQESGFKLPPNCLLEAKFKGWEAEKIYVKLPDPDEIKVPGNMIGEVREPKNDDGSPLSEGQRQQKEAEIKVTMTQAAQIARRQGNLPSGLERLVKELLEPKVNWKNILQEFVTQNSRNDYSMAKPNKRYIPMGVYLPILEKPELGELVIAIDTSGSLNEKDLAEIAAEIRSIMATYEVTLHVIYCDARVHPPVDEFTRGEDVELKMRGGGGTDYVPVFDYIKNNGIDPICLVYFTDGYCNSFSKYTPHFRTLWVLTEKNEGFKYPFGEVAVINL